MQLEINDGTCMYCHEGFATTDEIQGHEHGIWHPRCVPAPTHKSKDVEEEK